jgi:NifU-like protein involved in Fe-S cluster formation
MTEPLYTTEILRLAASLNESRTLQGEGGRAELRSPTCGSRIVTAVELDRDGHVTALTQEVHACAFGQASAALLERNATGRTHSEVADGLVDLSRWLAKEQDETGDWPGISALAPARPRKGRHGAILLPFRALLAAIEAANG